MGLGLPRYQLLPSGYEDLGQCVQLRLSFQLLRYGLELPRYLLLPSDYEDLGQCVQLRLSFQLLRYGLAVAALSAPAEWL